MKCELGQCPWPSVWPSSTIVAATFLVILLSYNMPSPSRGFNSSSKSYMSWSQGAHHYNIVPIRLYFKVPRLAFYNSFVGKYECHNSLFIFPFPQIIDTDFVSISIDTFLSCHKYVYNPPPCLSIYFHVYSFIWLRLLKDIESVS